MQRGIDSFFKRSNKSNKTECEQTPATKKRKKVIISSDEDEETERQETDTIQKKTRLNEETSPANRAKKPNLTKLKGTTTKELKKIDPTALFGGETKRVEAPKPPKPKEDALIELEDEDIDQSLLEINVDESLLDKQKENKVKRTPTKQHDEHKEKTPKSGDKKLTPKKRNGDHFEAEKIPHKTRRRSQSQEKHEVVEKPKTPKTEKTDETHTPRVKKHHKEDLESSVLSDEERQERKRMAAMLYQKYKHRSSCLNPGSKEVPKGKPNCLSGLTFLVTGVLESLERDEANSIIKEYGGKISTTVGKRLNYLIVGEDAGPKKLAQAEEFGIKILSEDGLLNLIRERSGEKSQNSSNNVENSKKKTPEKAHIKKEKVTPQKPKVTTSSSSKLKEETNDDDEFTITEVKQEARDEKAPKIKHETETSATNTNTEPTQSAISDDMLAWVDKYKPSSVKDVIGQANNVAKLTNWLSKWYSNHDGKKKLQKPNPWAKNDDGSFYKAALLSGPPGIGKTTTANLVCKELGFDAVEFNASDTRSKRLLKEEVAELLSNKSLYGYCHGNAQAVTKKHVLIMDEVDGMAGNEDRGGIQELIALIKDSSVPIICMCNDRNHPKMRSLVNYCYDLRFQKPRVEQIKARLLSILCREKYKIEPSKLEEIIKATNNDIRQSINHISMLSANKELDLNADQMKNSQKTAEKDLKLGPWEVLRKVFSAEEHKHMSIHDKCDLFFYDYSIAPLFVQQNYLLVNPQGPKNEVLKKVYKTAESLSLGDLADKNIRSKMAWSLLPTQAVFSSYMPGEFMCGHLTAQPNFPLWLGKFSRTNKRSRLAQELHDHTRLRTSGSRLSIRLDYAPFLLDKIVRPLKEKGMDGIEEALNVMKEYHLLREDIDSLLELTSWPGKKQDFEAVDGRVKAALTRAYNTEVLAYTYSAQAGIKKKRAEVLEDETALLGEEAAETVLVVESDEEDDKLENDNLIKAKKKPTATNSKASGTSKAKGANTKKTAGEGSKSKASTSKAKK